jgi:hypothetical protein
MVIKISSSSMQNDFSKQSYLREDFYSFTNELSKIVIYFSDFMPHKKKTLDCEKDEKFIEILKKELL